MAFNFASLSAFFGGGSNASSSSSGSRNKRTNFGSGLPSSSRRGPPGKLGDFDDGAAWSLPYTQRYGGPGMVTPLTNNGLSSPSSAHPMAGGGADVNGIGSAYPPTPNTARSWSGGNGMDPNAATSVTALGTTFGRPSVDAGGFSANVSIPSTAYPPLRHTWNRIRNWCDVHYDELGDTLNWPALDADLDELEFTIGFALPPAVRDSFLCYNGQELESNQSCSDGLFFGLPLLSIEQIAEEWKFWRTVDEDPSAGANGEVKGWMTSCPAGWVRSEYSCRGWLPLITDHVGNYVGVDLSPPASGGGAPGQVILFGRDFDTKVVLWRGEGEGGWGRFLQFFAEELESGDMWSLDAQSQSSDDEEDGIGYESYFSNGGSGTGKGGGDRAGEGSAGFRLRGDYKGWPVLEAWADRSMRCWEEVGLTAGQPAWQLQETPSVRLEEAEGAQRLNEHGEALDASSSGSTTSRQHMAPLIEHPSDGDEGQDHPLAGSSVTSPESARSGDTVTQSKSPSYMNGNTSLDGPRHYGDMLSPPLPSTKASRSKQKQREAAPGDSRQRRAPPPPAAALDLPTIDDVRAAHAAALAMSSAAGNYHFDIERSRPPPGSGGAGMGMGMRSSPVVAGSASGEWYRDQPRRTHTSQRVHQSGDDGLELDARTSSDVLNPADAGGSVVTLSDVVIDGTSNLNATALASPRLSSSSNPGGRPAPRTLLSNGEVPSLIDTGSAPPSPGLRNASTSSAAHKESAPPSSSVYGERSSFARTADSPTRVPPTAVKSPPHSRTNSILGTPRLDNPSILPQAAQ